MTNKILDHIEQVILERRRSTPTDRMSFTRAAVVDVPKPWEPVKTQIRVRSELRVFFEEWVSEGEGHAQRGERAKMAIARHLYADVMEALLDAREELWEDGRDPPKAMTKLMTELSGQFSRFE